MMPQSIHCNNTCHSTCSVLTKALQQQKSLLDFYKSVEEQCTYPGVHPFLRELIDIQNDVLKRIEEKIEVLNVNNSTINAIMMSFDFE